MRIVGEKFGKLRVLFMWIPDRFVCRCDGCGEHIEVFKSCLVEGVAKSCVKCTPGTRKSTHGHKRSYYTRSGKKHTKSSREYNSWSNMVRRCTNPKHHAYADYGGRGIQVCKEWLLPNGEGFRNFLASMGPRPAGMTLDRQNVQGHYEPGNCKWANRDDQFGNQRRWLFPEGNEPEVKPLDAAFGPDNSFETVEAAW